jgi:ribosome maturation factor RimP
MQSLPEKLRGLIGPVVSAMGYDLVGIEYRKQGRSGLLRVYIDHERGITLDDCSAVSHQVSGVLDVDDPIVEHYDLEISSPGLDRPLFSQADFEQFTGHEAKVSLHGKLDGRRRFTGVLRGVEGDTLLMEVEGAQVRLPLDQIDSARLVPEL